MVSITLPNYTHRLKLVLLFSLLSLFAPLNTDAQINPPDLLCIKNDTIIWSPPASLCGNFISYSIFISSNIDGPYSILTNVFSATQTEFYNPNANGNVWYYFMQTNAVCPGQPTISSDTLDSNPPIKGLTNHVSVIGVDVLIEWEPSPSPETNGYIIYRNTPSGTIVIANVGLVTSYLDTGADPTHMSETYFIVAVDGCGQTSLFGDGQSTIFVDSIINDCQQSVDLNWNLYENWINGIDHQEVWVGIDGDPPAIVATLNATDTTYSYTGLNDGDDYCILIKSYHLNRPDIATSNEICFTADIVQPVLTLQLTNATYDDDNNILLQWIWNVSSEVSMVTVDKSLNGTDFSYYSSIIPPDPMIQSVTQEIGSFVNMPGSQHFKITSIDLCDSTKTSNKASTIFLTGTPNQDHTNLLTWNTPYIEGATLLSYEIHSERLGGWQLTATADATDRSFVDAIDVGEEEEFVVCYNIVGIYEITLPNGNLETIRSQSNTICVEQFSTIWVPTAFAPYGLNNIFKPVVLFGEKVTYNMVVFNRYGEKMYESNEINDAWDGKLKGKIASQGVYTFIITVTQPSGRQIKERGFVTLLH